MVARYSIHVPSTDELGQPLRIHEAVHQHLTNAGWQNPTLHEAKPSHVVTAWAEDHPKADSHAKQIGAFVGQVANHPHIYVSKEGKTPANWPIANPHYRPGEGAEPSALAIHSQPA